MIPPYIYNNQSFNPGKTPVAYSGPYWDDRETEAAIDALLNGKWLTSGENVHAFEKRFGDMFHSKYNLMVNSGSSANLVMIAALKKRYNWRNGDEVIVSPVGFPTTMSVLVQNNLTPVFADIEWETLNFDLDKVENAITPRTRAIFLSPVLGNPPNMDELQLLCDWLGLELIVDNCDSLGSKWDGKYLSEYGIASSDSFYPAHHITTGEGGMVCTNDEKLHELMVSIAWWGRDCTCVGAANMLGKGSCGRRFDNWLPMYDGVVDHKYVFANMGYNLKPLDLQGAIGSVQLEKFDEIRARRIHSKETIEALVLDNIKDVRGVKVLDKADVSWFGTPFICEDKELKRRLVAHFEANKIQTRNYFAGNILLHPGYKNLGDYREYPDANQVLDKVFFLGAAPHYTEEVFRYIEKVIKSF